MNTSFLFLVLLKTTLLSMISGCYCFILNKINNKNYNEVKSIIYKVVLFLIFIVITFITIRYLDQNIKLSGIFLIVFKGIIILMVIGCYYFILDNMKIKYENKEKVTLYKFILFLIYTIITIIIMTYIN